MAPDLPPKLFRIEKEVRSIFKILTTGFQRIDKRKNAGRQSSQLEELTARMRDAKKLIKEFGRELQDESQVSCPESHKLLDEKKQSMIKELNSFVVQRKKYAISVGDYKVERSPGHIAGHASSSRGGPQADHDLEVRVSPLSLDALCFFFIPCLIVTDP